MRFSNATNRLPDYFKELSDHLNEQWSTVFETSADDLIDFLARDDAGEVNIAIKVSIKQALDKDQALLYYGSIEELTTRILPTPTDTIKAMAKINGKTYRIGLVRIGFTIVVIFVAHGLGTGLGKALEGAGMVAQQIVEEAAKKVGFEMSSISQDDG